LFCCFASCRITTSRSAFAIAYFPKFHRTSSRLQVLQFLSRGYKFLFLTASYANRLNSNANG